LGAAACQETTGPTDAASLGRGLTADIAGTTPLALVDALGAATPTVRFSVFGSGGQAIFSSQLVGPEFVLTQPTTITEIGAFLNNCEHIEAGVPHCPGTLPFTVQIRPSTNGIPDATRVLASFALSHDDDPLVISYESVGPNLTLGPGRYFALFAPQANDVGFLMANASAPFNYLAGLITLGFFNPTSGTSSAAANYGAVRILGTPATPQAAIQLLVSNVGTLVSNGELTQGQTDGLLNKLSAAIASLDRGRTKVGCNLLGAFANQVEGLVRAGQLRVGAGQALIDAVEPIRTQIDCQ
jgi:hypothetical protein